MLILRRRKESWLTITHAKSGEEVRVLVSDIKGSKGGAAPCVELGFEDPERNFQVEREERVRWVYLGDLPGQQLLPIVTGSDGEGGVGG